MQSRNSSSLPALLVEKEDSIGSRSSEKVNDHHIYRSSVRMNKSMNFILCEYNV